MFIKGNLKDAAGARPERHFRQIVSEGVQQFRSAWMAQELLHTFADDLAEVTLRPGTGGIFEITLRCFRLVASGKPPSRLRSHSRCSSRVISKMPPVPGHKNLWSLSTTVCNVTG
jgi:hypothetical protein